MNLLASFTTSDLKKGSSEVENTFNKKKKKKFAVWEKCYTYATVIVCNWKEVIL